MRSVARALSIAMAAGLVGCLPLPSFERIAPEIDGQVTTVVEGVPADRLVKRVAVGGLAHIAGCAQDGDVTTTDATGRFHFDGAWRFSPVIPLYGDPYWQVVVCMQGSDGALVPAWQAGHIGGPPARVALECRAEGNAAIVQCEADRR